MNVIDSKSIVDGSNYIVWYDFKLGDTDGIFVLHMQGGYKLLKMIKYLMTLNKPIFFCEGLEGVWKNHRKLVGEFSNGNLIYQFIWKNKDEKCKVLQ